MKIKLMLSIVVLIALSLYLFNTLAAVKHQNAQKANTTQLETYSYVITSIDETGVYGDSLTDDTGIFLTHENIKGMNLSENDHIAVQFPLNNYETITSVTKIK